MNLDSLYFRNRDTIAAQQNPRCSGYKSLQSYSSCSEDTLKTTKMEARDFSYKKPETAKPKPAATPEPAPVTESFLPGV